MSEIIIGKVSLSPCGEFQFGTFYKRLSVINYLGSYYVAAKDNQSVLPTVYGTWFPISEVCNTIENIVLVSTSGNTSTYRINFTNGDYFDFEIENNLVTKTSEITNDSGFITSQVDDLTNYITKDLSGSSIEFTFNSSTYVITVKLLNSEGNVISTQTVSLPLSSTIVGATYQNATVILSTRGGSTINVSINDIVPTSRKIAELGLNQNIGANDLAAALGIYTSTQIDNIIDPMQEELILMESNFDKMEAHIVGNGQLTDSLNGGTESHSISGNTTQETTTGANKFSINWFQPRETNGITATIVDDHIVLNGKATGNVYINFLIPENTFADAYVYMYIKSDAVFNNVHINDTGSSGSGSLNITPSTSWTKTVMNIHVSTGGYIFVATDVQLTNCKVYFDVRESNIDITDFVYEPYTGGQPSPSPSYPQNIVDVTGTQTIYGSNKNLFNTENISPSTAQGVSITAINDNKLVVSNSIAGAYRYGNVTINGLKKNTNYTFRAKYINSNTSVTTLWVSVVNGAATETIFNNSYISNQSFTFNSGDETSIIIRPHCTVSSVTNSATWYDIQLEEGSTATSYEPHKGKTVTLTLPEGMELCKIGNHVDYLYKNETDDRWYIHKEIGKRVLNGSEDWYVDRETYRFDGLNAKPFSLPFPVDAPLAISSRFIWGNGSATTFVYGSMWYVTNGTTFVVQKDESPTAETLETFKTWLSSNNVTVCYLLATQTDTKITDTTLLEDLELLKQLKTYKYITNINITNNNGIATILDFIYWGSDTAALQNRVTTLESQVALLE
ncbi:MAG: hypothetical protein J6T10_14665 [Methanobrevibacter sp.]|nr:hypothetical protein [Methanobrevibacter sp.]